MDDPPQQGLGRQDHLAQHLPAEPGAKSRLAAAGESSACPVDQPGDDRQDEAGQGLDTAIGIGFGLCRHHTEITTAPEQGDKSGWIMAKGLISFAGFR